MILAAQEQALRTNLIKHSIDKTSETPLCRLCGYSTETVREYTKRHDKVALRVHWEMCRKYGTEFTDKWFDHKPLGVKSNEDI